MHKSTYYGGVHLLNTYYGTQNVYVWRINQKELRCDVRNSLVIKTVLFAHQKQGKDK